jgi:hypothetical protein
MALGPIRRRSQDWGWNDPEPEPEFDVTQDDPFYLTPETAAAAVYLISDPKFNKKTTKWVQKRLRETQNPDLIKQELATSFMNTLIDGTNALKSPYRDLAAVSLEQIDWASLADTYTAPISGPQYLGDAAEEEEGIASLQQVIDSMSGDEDMPTVMGDLVTPPPDRRPQRRVQQPAKPPDFYGPPSGY